MPVHPGFVFHPAFHFHSCLPPQKTAATDRWRHLKGGWNFNWVGLIRQ
jgi:hypothetical protein